jgi:hypothetical protein
MDINISYKTTNTIKKNLLAYKQQASMDKYSTNGIYALNCPDCSKRCLWQTERPFRVRFKGHFMSCKYQHKNSRFA